ncbi:MAG: DUF7144 family membrane protein [Candidatus Limnocylindria bacterium]
MDPQQLAPAPPPVAAAERPGHLLAAAVILIVLGVLVALIGAVLLLFGALFGSLADMPEITLQVGRLPDALGGFFVVLGLLILGYGVLQVATGIAVLPGRSWARITGMILASLGALFGLAGLFPVDGGGVGGGAVVSVVIVSAYVYTIWALASQGGWFARRPG